MRRVAELTRVAGFMAGLLLLWRARVDAPGALAIASAWEPAMPRAVAAAVSAEDVDDDVDGVEYWAIHWATTAWLCRLSLPSSEPELWGGPPIHHRVITDPSQLDGAPLVSTDPGSVPVVPAAVSDPPTITVTAEHRDALYSLAFGDLGGEEGNQASGSGRHRLYEDLAQMLVDLGQSGSGEIVLKILRPDDFRRVFLALSMRATQADGTRRDLLVLDACDRVLAVTERARMNQPSN